MNTRTHALCLAVLICCGSKSVSAQVVQLPTFEVFTVATTVMVPDRGSMYLGGVNRAAYGSNSVGVPGLSKVPGLNRLFTNRGIGSEISSSGAYASAHIMDLGELDREVLAEAAARRAVSAAGGTENVAVNRKAAFIAKNIARNDRTPVRVSPPPRTRQGR
jgi:hypothetical protein